MTRRGYLRLVVLLCGLLSMVSAGTGIASQADCGDGVVTLLKGQGHYEISGCVQHFEDGTRDLGISDLLQFPDEYPFAPPEEGILNYGYTSANVWVRFEIDTSRLSDPSYWLLQLELPLADDVAAFLVQDGQVVREARSGYETPWAERDVEVSSPVFKYRLLPDEQYAIYLEVYSESSVRLPLSLWQEDAYVAKTSIEQAVRGGVLGGLMALLVYNLFVACSVRQASNTYFVLMMLALTAFVMTLQVHGMRALDTRPFFLHKDLLPYQILTGWLFGSLMAGSLLSIGKKSKDIHKVLKVCSVSTLVTMAIGPFVEYRVLLEWAVIYSVGIAMVLLFVSVQFWKDDDGVIRSYTLAWCATICGMVIYAAMILGFLEPDLLTNNAPQIGMLTQAILLSFALADRVKQVQNQSLAWSRRALNNMRLYRSLFDNALEGVFQISLDRTFLTVNPAMATLFGFPSPKHMTASGIDALVTCFSDERQRAFVIDQLKHRGSVKGIEAVYLSRSGETRWATISLTTVYDRSGSPMHLEGTCIDSTERHQRQVAEKERENERMEKELARSSAAAKSQFLANMSHEIRTPLSAIIGYGEMLIDPDVSDAEKANSARTVVRSGRHLLDLVNDILDHSKIEAGKLQVERLPVGLADILDDIRHLFEPRAREKGLEFLINIQYPIPQTILSDPTRLRQIIINLCGNALKFTETGSIALNVACDRENEKLTLAVIDTGIGMKKEQLGRLFDAFAQGSAAIARQYGGTGLGLNISRRLSEMMGGTIVVRSEYGKGSEFEATVSTGALDNVAFIRNASELQRLKASESVTRKVKIPRLRGRILCADDNEVNRRLVSLLVDRTGAEVIHARDGAQALDTATHEKFDLILMDIQMPVMNGRDATVALREAGITVPIIALTANVMQEDIEDYHQAGCTAHLAKPIDKAKLYSLLRQYLPAAGEFNDPSPTSCVQLKGVALLAGGECERAQALAEALSSAGMTVIREATAENGVRAALGKTVHAAVFLTQTEGLPAQAAIAMLRQTGFMRPILAVAVDDHPLSEDEWHQAGATDIVSVDSAITDVIATLADRLAPSPDRKPSQAAQTVSSATSKQEDDFDEEMEALRQEFISRLPEQLEAMQQAVRKGDARTTAGIAHQLKGTGGAMGFQAISEKAAILEETGKSESGQDALEKALEALESELRSVIPSADEHSTPN